MLPADAASKASETAPAGVNRAPGPVSTEEPRRNLDYLLEDEPHPGHVRMFVALILLVAAGALLAWHWHSQGLPWANRQAIENATQAASSQAVAPSPVPSPAHDAQGSQASRAVTSVPKPEEPPKATAGTPPQEPPAQAVEPTTPTTTLQADTGKETSRSEEPSPAMATELPPTTTEPGSVETAVRTAPPKPKDVAPKSPPTPALSSSDKLVADGEKYLYGDGVTQNCARARKDLTTAAKKANAKAQSLLGAMYATGHCVNRDLPSAYRWFAKALHQDPANKRVQQDLEVLWRQMSSDERQAALRPE